MAKRIADKNLTDKNWNQEDEVEEAGAYPIASESVLKSRAIKKAVRRNAGGEGESPRGFKGLEGVPATLTTSAASGAAAAPPVFFGFGNGTIAFSGLSSLANGNGTTPLFGSFSSPTHVTANATPGPTLKNPASSSKPTADIASKQTAGSTPSLTLSANSSSSSSIFNSSGISGSSSCTRSSNKDYKQELAALNCSVRDWITKHVDVNPLLDLSPVFRDYEQHLANIDEKYAGAAAAEEEAAATAESATALEGLADREVSGERQWALLPTTSTATSLSSSSSSGSTPSFSFVKDKDGSSPEKSSFAPLGLAVKKHNFGQKADTSAMATLGSAGGHLPTTITPTSLALSSSSSSTLFPFNKNKDAFSSSTIPFTFDKDKYLPLGFSFSSPFGQASRFRSPQASSSSESVAPFPSGWPGGEGAETVQPAYESADTESDEPPKPEVVEVKETDAFYSKKCKLFYKKDSEFKEKGVGTLHLKHTPEGKTQLIVRADTNLGNILLNIILQASMPCSRMGKNNVLVVCVPNPSVDDNNPTSPLPLLIRVKTTEDADELHKRLEGKKVL